MIDEFSWQLTLSEDNINCSQSYQEDSNVDALQDEIESTITSNIKDKRVRKNTIEDDVNILIDVYGELFPSKLIEIDLNEACRLLNRERHRIDAFSRLVKYLYKEYQTTLKITSRKTR